MRLPLPLLPAALLALCLTTLADATRPRPSIVKRKNPTYSQFPDSSLATLANLTNLDTILDFNDPTSALSRLLIPRPAGSKNLTDLQSLVERHFIRLGWHVERDHFEAQTPYGLKPFTNLVFTHDPDATRRLVLSAHIDSKFFPTQPEDQFVGATDSAAPCAMLLDVAEALTPWLNDRKKRIMDEGGEEGRLGQGETLQIIYFDGEEAFKDWTHTDSIYGARHLVKQWLQPSLPPSPTAPKSRNTLSRISHLVLLDLLGARNPVIRSFFTATGWFFDEFQHSEERLGSAGLLWESVEPDDYAAVKNKAGAMEQSFFLKRKGVQAYAGGIEDDHIPFVENGVPVVHLITLPFPRVWHTIADDATALDLPTIKAWALIVRLTVAEYLGLDPALNGQAERHRRATEDLTFELLATESYWRKVIRTVCPSTKPVSTSITA
ncbi:glutaminyl-peptide cyclotransferase, partial [Phenoliferia sp. Uapishka_3]